MDVAIIKSPFLPTTEIFIYNWTIGLQKYKPYIISEYQINNDQFPVENIITHRTGKEWYEPIIKTFRDWLAGKIQRELIYHRFYYNSLIKIKPNLVHIYFGAPGLLLYREIRKLKIPLIVSFLGFDISQLPAALGEDVYIRNKLFDNGKLFTVDGSNSKKRLIQLGCPPKKVHLLRVGLDIKKYKYKIRKKKDRQPIKVLFCGRFVGKKGILVAIKSVAKVINENSEIIFTIIGDGPLKDKAHELVNKLNISKHVNFLGMLKQDSFIAECYENHFLVAPSQTDDTSGDTETGVPTVILQSQATGMPIISTYHADIPELVNNNKSGLLVKEGDVDALYKAIMKMIDKNAYWGEMGINGRKNVIKKHDISIVSERLEYLYDIAIGS